MLSENVPSLVRLVSPKLTRNMGGQIAQRPALDPGITGSMQRRRSVEGRPVARGRGCERDGILLLPTRWFIALHVDID
jgi:hypothetical protein